MPISKKSLNSKKIIQTAGELVCPSNIKDSTDGIIELVRNVLNFFSESDDKKELIDKIDAFTGDEGKTYTFALEDSIEGPNKSLFIEKIKAQPDKTFTLPKLKEDLKEILQILTTRDTTATTTPNVNGDNVNTNTVGGGKKNKTTKKSSKKGSKKSSKTMKGGKKTSKKVSKKVSKKASKKTSKKK